MAGGSGAGRAPRGRESAELGEDDGVRPASSLSRPAPATPASVGPEGELPPRQPIMPPKKVGKKAAKKKVEKQIEDKVRGGEQAGRVASWRWRR